MLLLFFFALLLFFVCVCFFSKDRNMIYIATVEFRYYVAIITPVDLEKTLSYKRIRQARLISFQ